MCRRTLRLYGCKVSLIEPGFFVTSLTDRANVAAAITKVWSRLPVEIKEEFGEEYYNKCKLPFKMHVALTSVPLALL